MAQFIMMSLEAHVIIAEQHMQFNTKRQNKPEDTLCLRYTFYRYSAKVVLSISCEEV